MRGSRRAHAGHRSTAPGPMSLGERRLHVRNASVCALEVLKRSVSETCDAVCEERELPFVKARGISAVLAGTGWQPVDATIPPGPVFRRPSYLGP